MGSKLPIWVDMMGGGVKKGQKVAMSFMDGPLYGMNIFIKMLLQKLDEFVSFGFNGFSLQLEIVSRSMKDGLKW